MSDIEQLDDVEFFFYAVDEHYKIARANTELLDHLCPFGSNFYPIIHEASKQFHPLGEDCIDETRSVLSEPDDTTYVEEWDPIELVAWMLETYGTAPDDVNVLYFNLVKTLETRLQSRAIGSQIQEPPRDGVKGANKPADATRANSIAACKFPIMPPRRLPPEILGEIFLLAAEDVPLMPITLSHIDRFSRHVAINLPRLWSTISIRLAPPIIDLYLARSNLTPLFVDAMVPPLLDSWSIKAEQRCKGFLFKLKPHIHRVRVLKCPQFNLMLPDLIEILDILMSSGLGPELKELEFGEMEEQVEEWLDSQLPGIRHGERDALIPRCVTIHGAYSTCWAFQAISFARLRQLNITDNPTLDFNDLLGALSQAPSLESLRLVNCAIKADEGLAFPVLSLPNLRTLELIHLTAPEIPFFDSLGTFPRLSSFTMTIVDVVEPNPEADLIQFIQRHPSIRAVYLHDFVTTPDGWRMVLGSFASATHLRLSSCNLEDIHLSALSDPDSNNALMPHLVHLTLDNELFLHSDTVARIVRDRLAAGTRTPNPEVQPLKSVTLRGWDASKMNPEDLASISNSVDNFVLDTFDGGASPSGTESDAGTDYEYCWSDISSEELGFGNDISTL
ncbi:hypothetical protein FRC04_011285 [Tulasnella sp. 424]|nr:hypothetical protein FRC04_011285 [Tulasnella sp. 424]KAG8971823.1 hypothetical protein FRC05_010783 [Tulasnella sp. 425]